MKFHFQSSFITLKIVSRHFIDNYLDCHNDCQNAFALYFWLLGHHIYECKSLYEAKKEIKLSSHSCHCSYILPLIFSSLICYISRVCRPRPLQPPPSPCRTLSTSCAPRSSREPSPPSPLRYFQQTYTETRGADGKEEGRIREENELEKRKKGEGAPTSL